MAGRFSVDAQFRAIDRMTKPIDRMQRRISKFTRVSGRQFSQLNKKVAAFSGRAFSTAATVGVGGLSLAIADGTRKAISFEQTLVNAAARFPEGIKKGTKNFIELANAARKTGSLTEFTSIQAAEALNFFAMASFNAKQAIAALPATVDLATASGVDLATATDMATDTLGAFGLSVKDPIQLAKNLSRVSDVLAKTTTSANTDMEQLFETIIEGGAVAKSAGASIETYAALTGKMANAGIKGGAAGTTLKNVFIRLAAQTPKAEKALKRLGVTTKDQEGNLRDVVDIFEDINKGIQREKLGTAETAAVLNDIFGRIPIAGVNVLLNEGADSLRKYRRELEGATGASGKMATQMRDTLQGQINSLLSAFEGLQITLFFLNDNAFGKVIESMTKIVRNLDTWVQANEELSSSIITDIIDTVLGVIQVIGIMIAAYVAWKLINMVITASILAFQAVLLTFKGIMIAYKIVLWAITMAQSAFNLALFLGISPVLLVVAAIGALIVAGALLLEYWDPISDFFIDMWDKISSAFSSGIDFVMGLLNPFQKVIGGIGGLFEKFGIVFNGDREAEQEAEDEAESYRVPENIPQVVSQAMQLRRTVEETRESSKAELLIRDETGRAQLRSGAPAPGVKIAMVRSGDA